MSLFQGQTEKKGVKQSCQFGRNVSQIGQKCEKYSNFSDKTVLKSDQKKSRIFPNFEKFESL